MQEKNVASMNATNVSNESSQKKLQSITLVPLSTLAEASLPMENISSECSQTQPDGKSCAKTVTTLKQEGKMNEGKKFDAGKPPMELLSHRALLEAAKVMGEGKNKYGAQNWRAGLAWSRVIGAAYRHLGAFNDGQDLDPETGLSHVAHLLCCAMFLLEYISTHPEMDDRYKHGKLESE